MATAIAGQVLGPQPGRAICSFWQGGVEMSLRLIAPTVGSLPALIAVCIALGTLISGNIALVPSDHLQTGTLGSSGCVLAVTALSMVIELLLIVVRICNIGLINIKVKIFLIADVVTSCVLATGHFVGGVVSAYYSNQWSDVTTEPTTVRDALAASSAFSFLSVILFGCLAVWSIMFLRNEWNKAVIKYTLKHAITG